MRPKATAFGRAHGLPKIHKQFSGIPAFRPIIDTTTTPHYNVGKFLASLLNPLTINEYSLKDSFQAASDIKEIPQNLFDQGYRLVSFDVESLFTNVPLKRTISIILSRVFNDKMLDTTLQKRTLKKLLSDACTKTAFSFDNILYEQIDGVSMGSCLAPVLANIILTELEKTIVEDLLKSGILKFYRRYVDDTLVLIKPFDIPFVLSKLNSFDKNLKFTVDTFEDGKVHFLDLEITDRGINVYRKPTHTGQYTHFDSFEPWTRKTAWVKSLFHRATKICSNSSFLNEQIAAISKFMSWNGFRKNIRSSIIRKLKAHENQTNEETNEFEDTRLKVWLRIPYLGKQGEFLVKKLIKKLQRHLTQPVKFIVIYQTKKVSYFLSKKDKIPDCSRSNVVYKFTCPGCAKTYIGKTERNLDKRLSEHSDPLKSAVAKHVTECEHANFILNLNNLYDNINDDDTNDSDKRFSYYDLLLTNTKILQSLQSNNSNILLYLEALHIKVSKPELNSGLKASKELLVFP